MDDTCWSYEWCGSEATTCDNFGVYKIEKLRLQILGRMHDGLGHIHDGLLRLYVYVKNTYRSLVGIGVRSRFGV